MPERGIIIRGWQGNGEGAVNHKSSGKAGRGPMAHEGLGPDRDIGKGILRTTKKHGAKAFCVRQKSNGTEMQDPITTHGQVPPAHLEVSPVPPTHSVLFPRGLCPLEHPLFV